MNKILLRMTEKSLFKPRFLYVSLNASHKKVRGKVKHADNRCYFSIVCYVLLHEPFNYLGSLFKLLRYLGVVKPCNSGDFLEQRARVHCLEVVALCLPVENFVGYGNFCFAVEARNFNG